MALKAGSLADRKSLGMIALKALNGGPPENCGPGEPLVRSIRIPLWRKLISGAGLELRVVPSAFLLILGGYISGLVAVTPAPAAAAKSAYAMTDLGNLGGGVSLGFGIKASGEVVGRSYLDKVFFFKCGRHACRFAQNDPFSWTAGTMTDLGSTQSANAINDNGQVTGWTHTASEATHVFMWSNGTITDLGTFGLDPVGEAINNHGVIVGQSSLGAWIWSEGLFQNLNNLIAPGSGFTLRQRHRDLRQRPDRRQRLQRPKPGARVPAHPASVRAQDLPPARLIHAGRRGRLWGARDCSHHLAERTDTGGESP